MKNINNMYANTYKGAVVINSKFLNFREVKRVLKDEGCVGLGKIVMVNTYLLQSAHGIGLLSDVPSIAEEAHMRPSNLLRWIRECGVYIIDEKNGLFFYVRYRRMMKYPDTLAQAEIDYILDNGNIFMPDEVFPRNSKCNEQVSEIECKVEHKTPAKASDKPSRKSVENRHKTNSKRKVIDFLSSENTDNESITQSLYNDSYSYSDITSIVSNISTNTSTQKSAVAKAGGEEEDFKNFEKIFFLNKKWRRCVSKTRCIDLTNDKILHIFTDWMFDYCIANGQLSNDTAKILHYAFSILDTRMNTRKAFDRYLKTQMNDETKVADNAYDDGWKLPPANYERLVNGKRIAFGGQVLPECAPPQPSLDSRYNYKRNCWVTISI